MPRGRPPSHSASQMHTQATKAGLVERERGLLGLWLEREIKREREREGEVRGGRGKGGALVVVAPGNYRLPSSNTKTFQFAKGVLENFLL